MRGIREFFKGEDMKKKSLIYMIVAIVLAVAFCVLTVLLVSVDVRPAGQSRGAGHPAVRSGAERRRFPPLSAAGQL